MSAVRWISLKEKQMLKDKEFLKIQGLTPQQEASVFMYFSQKLYYSKSLRVFEILMKFMGLILILKVLKSAWWW
jgi:hypothetical protein